MGDTIKAAGMVIRSEAYGEYDRRLVLLTTELGKITVFAKGAKRQGSTFMASTRLFAFGTFVLYAGKSAYNLREAQISQCFDEIAADMEAACYGSYFLELTDYLIRDQMEGRENLKLLYQSLRALSRPALPKELVRRVFELKSLVLYGEYQQFFKETAGDSANYAWEYVVYSPVERLYQFTLTKEVLAEFARMVEKNMKTFVGHSFQSLKILESIIGY